MSAALSALHPAIASALREVFGDQPVEDLAPMTGGRSGAEIFSLNVARAAYVVRCANPARPAHELRLARETTCLRIASERGVAPRLHYADATTGVTIMDRIEVRPPPRGPLRIERVARTLRRLHEGPAFPPLVPGGGGVTGVVTSVATSVVHHIDQVVRANGAAGLPDALVRTMDELAHLTRRFSDSAPCHNDLNPGNVLETADAVYFVDWESACASDPFLDLAELGVFGFPAESERTALLVAYLGRPPTAEEAARATIARVMALGLYASAFVLTTVLGGGPARVTAAPLPIPEMLALLGAARERAPAEVVAASLFEEMRREAVTAGYEEAKRAL